jgi:hypothetical protein
MAGLGRRTFAPGEVLTASNVMNYLQDQVIQTYAGTAARGSAIGTAVSQGMVSFRQDTGNLEIYYAAFGTANPGGKTPAGWYREAGQIAQVVYASTNSQVNNSTGSAISTGLSASITPTLATSRIIVLVNQNGIGKTSQSNTGMNINFNKSSTPLARFGENLLYGPVNDFIVGSASYIHTEIAGTTSSINYNTTFWQTGAAGAVNVQRDGSLSTMMIIEVTA